MTRSRNTRHSPRRAAALVASLACLAAAPAALASSTPRQLPGPVIAFVDETTGVNVLHTEFRTAHGEDAVLPMALRSVARVSLPQSGTFEQRLAALRTGSLSHLRPGVPVYVRGTRVLVVAAPQSTVPVTDAIAGDMLHATGVVDSAIGRKFGTAPDALGIVILGSAPSAYAWAASQPWIDIVSTSGYDVPQVQASSSAGPTTQTCLAATSVNRLTSTGRLVLSSSGNTTDPAEQASVPNGLPNVYQVGGVDSAGKPWLPPHVEEPDPFYAAAVAQHPYDSGELFSYQAAAPDSFTGTVHFGGTSGATPRTAGRAAILVASARRLLGSTTALTGSTHVQARGPRRVSRGPLVDGQLTLPELTDLMLHTAAPAESATPGRYFVEGYGALSDSTEAQAIKVLAGKIALPVRPDEDRAYQLTHQVRAATQPRYC